MTPELYNHRHSLSHILAQAIQRTIDPEVQLGIGPAINDGMYYDMIFSEGIHFNELRFKDLEKQMQKICKEGQDFQVYQATDASQAQQIIDLTNQKFKTDLLKGFVEEGQTKFTFWINTINAAAKDKLLAGLLPEYIAYYEKITAFMSGVMNLEGRFVTFIDLCEGGHVENTNQIADGSFSIAKIAGAYWRGSEKNPMMTRIYGYAFSTKDELKTFLHNLEEAKKRDHRVLGQKMKLFTISQLVGSGLPLLQPNGMIIRKEIEDYLWSLHKDKGYDRVRTPHLAKAELYQTSGHSKHYMDDMFSVKGGSSNEDFYVKPMNCPHHMQLFADNQFSYRDMPVRYFEPATVYRDEKTGQLSGLTRVRAITQDDGHLFCRIQQIGNEINTIVGIIKQFYTTMGMIEGYRVRLSIKDPKKPEDYLGSEEVWTTAESALKAVCEEQHLPYQIGEGEAAFYGPKLDFMFKDAIGREWQLATIQCDFNLPERFDLSFTNEQGEKERPVVIHRAISGSLERFMGVMIEHFGGMFPLWLAPRQVMIVPVADVFNDKAHELGHQMKSQGLRVRVDEGSDSFSKKIRNAELEKIPYIIILGEKEIAGNTVSVRNVKTKEQFESSTLDFIAQLVNEVSIKAL